MGNCRSSPPLRGSNIRALEDSTHHGGRKSLKSASSWRHAAEMHFETSSNGTHSQQDEHQFDDLKIAFYEVRDCDS
jgi:hypothetical protein